MIVCSCFVVNCQQIRDIASKGKPFRHLCRTLKLGTNCGACLFGAKAIFDEEKAKSRQAVKALQKPTT